LSFLAVGCRLIAGQEGAEPQPRTNSEDLLEGRKIYATQCSYCHGPRGGGGQGAVLAVKRLAHAPDDQALFRVIREGIPGTRMPASALTKSQIWQVTAFVRTLSRMEGPRSTGNAQLGKQVYEGKGGCSRCHTVAGQGGAIGPDLSGLGAHQSADELRTSLVNPDASVSLNFLQVRVVTKDGQSLTGVRVNEDTFSLQMRDLSNQFHSFWKSELTEIVKEPKHSLMPSYRSALTPAELENVVAYLESLP
jgi:putative heme-binding domain-containing protein